MRVAYCDVVMQEVPGEIAMAVSFTGCPRSCAECHSPELRDPSYGSQLSAEEFGRRLDAYRGLLTCVMFSGGEWDEEQLSSFIDVAIDRGLKTCLYTGASDAPAAVKQKLTYVKTGAYVPELGGLGSPATNQRFVDLKRGVDLTSLFARTVAPSFKEAWT